MKAHERNLRVEHRQAALFGLAAVGLVTAGTVIVAYLAVTAVPFVLQHRSALISWHWDPRAGHFGLWPFLGGTAAVTAVALTVAVPLALSVGIVGARVAGPQLRSGLVRVLTVLAAVPSVVYGWWGLAVIVPAVRRVTGGPGFSILAAGIVLGLMLIPTLALLFQEAIVRVPREWVEGSLALGATEDQTLVYLLWPCAGPGLARAVVVGLARAFGETMAVQMVIGGQPAWTSNLAHPGATLTTQILTDLAVFPPGTGGYRALAAMALILVGTMYALVRWSERWEGPQ